MFWTTHVNVSLSCLSFCYFPTFAKLHNQNWPIACIFFYFLQYFLHQQRPNAAPLPEWLHPQLKYLHPRFQRYSSQMFYDRNNLIYSWNIWKFIHGLTEIILANSLSIDDLFDITDLSTKIWNQSSDLASYCFQLLPRILGPIHCIKASPFKV